tara:strand:- start:53 stop:289 length:237 start_codon:yes stop_codon:yes gene_type:complete
MMSIMTERAAKETTSSYYSDIAEIRDDPESEAALQCLEKKGLCSSRVHGAYSEIVRENRGKPQIPEPLDMCNDNGTPI